MLLARWQKKYKIVQSRLLNEIDSGACTGMTYKTVQAQMPEEVRPLPFFYIIRLPLADCLCVVCIALYQFTARERDKLRYRYPHGGESYTDLIERLKPIIIELERYHTPVFVICHQAVMRVLLAYFVQAPQARYRSTKNSEYANRDSFSKSSGKLFRVDFQRLFHCVSIKCEDLKPPILDSYFSLI